MRKIILPLAVLLGATLAPVGAGAAHTGVIVADVATIGGAGSQVVSGDGLVVAASDLTGIHIWDRATGATETIAGGSAPALSDDGRYLAYSKLDGAVLRVYWRDRQAGGADTLVSNTANNETVVAISDDGQTVVYNEVVNGAGGLQTARNVRTWNRSGVRQSRTGFVTATALSGNGRFVVLAPGEVLATRVSQIWDTQVGTVTDYADRVAAISDDGTKIVMTPYQPNTTEATSIRFRNITTGSGFTVSPLFDSGVGPKNVLLSGDGSTISFTTNRRLVAADVDSDPDTYLISTPAGGAIDFLPEPGGAVDGLSDDGRRAVYATPDAATSQRTVRHLRLTSATLVPVTSIDRPQLTDQIGRLYQAYFLRAPDAAGLEYWSTRRASRVSLESISAEFAGGAEFTTRYGQLSNAAFVDLVYRNVLGREPDAQGAAFWVGRLAAGVRRGDIMLAFSEAPEFLAKTGTSAPVSANPNAIWRLYRAYFTRGADQAGMDFWVESMAGGTTLSTISNEFAAGAEFRSRYGTLSNAAFVDLVYGNVLGRPADASGAAFWVGRLNAGATRGDVMLGFSESAEFLLATNTLP